MKQLERAAEPLPTAGWENEQAVWPSASLSFPGRSIQVIDRHPHLLPREQGPPNGRQPSSKGRELQASQASHACSAVHLGQVTQ